MSENGYVFYFDAMEKLLDTCYIVKYKTIDELVKNCARKQGKEYIIDVDFVLDYFRTILSILKSKTNKPSKYDLDIIRVIQDEDTIPNLCDCEQVPDMIKSIIDEYSERK